MRHLAPLLIVLSALSISAAFASSDEATPASFVDLDAILSRDSAASTSRIEPAEAFVRQMAVFDHYGIPTEPDSQPLLAGLERRQTQQGAQALLSVVDPTGTSRRLLSLDNGLATMAQDADSRRTADFSIELSANRDADQQTEPVFESDEFDQHLRAASLAARSDKPLAGLRIALDPGHSGSEPWDTRDGKFVRDRSGRTVREGQIALQTAMLLEQDLQALGAETMITRRSLKPVTDLDYASFDLYPWAQQEFSELALEPWFRNLLGTAPAGSKLYRAFDRDANVKKIFAENDANRWKYFFVRADLEARIDRINAFHPDITLIIHFDTSDPPGNPTGVNPNGYDRTKAYVVGSYEPKEFSTRKARRLFAEHLLHQKAYEGSLALGQSIIGEIKSSLGLDFDTTGGGVSSQIAPGMFARNLTVSRGLTRHAVSYVEVLYYNAPREFEALLDASNPMTIDGESMPYSNRIREAATALKNGVVSFVANYH